MKKGIITPDTEKEYLINAIKFFFSEKTSFDGHKKSFDIVKQDFEKDMDLLFDKYSNEEDELKVRTDDTFAGISGVKVKKVQPKSTSVDVNAFRKAVKDKELKKELMSVSYTVTDIIGLLKYLREIGVRYEDVNSFIRKTYSVDEGALNNAYELGKIDYETVEKCIKVTNKKPYYKLTPVKQTRTRKPIVDA